MFVIADSDMDSHKQQITYHNMIMEKKEFTPH
jgi:hypothetical protein